jgi:hypothetical protein
MSSSGDGTGNLVGATPHVKKKHTGRWSNVSMEVNHQKNMKDADIKKLAKLRQDIEVPRNIKLDAIARNTCYDFTMIMISIAYAIQVAVVVVIEDKDHLGNKDMLALSVLQFIFIAFFVFDLVFLLMAKGFYLYFSNVLNIFDGLFVIFILVITIIELIQDIKGVKAIRYQEFFIRLPKYALISRKMCVAYMNL